MGMNYCPFCGSQLVENAKFCSQCGKPISDIQKGADQEKEIVQQDTEVINTLDTQHQSSEPAPLHTIKIGKYSFQVPESVIVYNKIRSQFVDYAAHSQKDFETQYDQDVNSFETLYDKALPAIVVSAANALRFTISELDKYGLTITPEEFLRIAKGNIYLDDVLQEYVDTAKRLEEFVEQLKSYRAKNRSQGIQWQGGGFGLSGAIRGAVMAGALNIATDAVRGIGHAVVDSADRARLRKVQLDLYKARDHKSFLGKRLYTFCMNLFDTAIHLLEEKNLIARPPFNTVAGISAITEAFDLVNGTKAPNQEDYETALKLTLQGMPHDPYFLLSYLTLYKIPFIDKEDLLDIVEFFGMESPFYEKIEEYEKPILGSFRTMPEDTIADIERKLARAEELKSKSCYATISFHQLEAKKEKFIKDSEDLLAKKMEEMRKQKESETRFAEIKELPEDNFKQMKSKYNALASLYVTPDVEAEIIRLTQKIKEERTKRIDRPSVTIETDSENLSQQETPEIKERQDQITKDTQTVEEETKRKKAEEVQKVYEEDQAFRKKHDLDTLKSVVDIVDQYIKTGNFEQVWGLQKNQCAYAEYALLRYYMDTYESVIKTGDLGAISEKISDVIERANNQDLFAQYLVVFIRYETIRSRSILRNEKNDKEYIQAVFELANYGVLSAIGRRGSIGCIVRELYNIVDTQEQSLLYLKFAADRGDVSASASLGAYYRTGKYGLPVNLQKAEYYLARSAECRHPKAIEELKLLKEHGSAIPGKCFITSAVCQYLGKSDDCYELTAFRSFRDSWLRMQPGGRELIEEYYRIAPGIVAAIDSQPNSPAIYQSILDNYLIPCLRYIELGQYDKCKDTYVTMVNTLKKQYEEA